MDSISLMMEEHQYILRMLKVVRKICIGIMNGDSINYEDFDKIIDFIKVYSDDHHHGKEEKFLFDKMVEHLGALGHKLVNHGMLVEHNIGRLYIQELISALERVKLGDEESRIDVVANAISYTHHMKRHIEKEDAVVYTFARRQLSDEILEEINNDTKVFEDNAVKNNTQQYYISLLDFFEKKTKLITLLP